MAIMARKNTPHDKLLAEMRKTTGRPMATADSRPLLLPNDPSEDFLTGEDWVNVGAAMKLTARELQVATLLFGGLTRAGVARRLHRDVETIRVYIDRLFKKFEVRDLRGLVLRIARLHLAIRFKLD
jgi:DNA-binding NarL/FixJ family response regulator